MSTFFSAPTPTPVFQCIDQHFLLYLPTGFHMPRVAGPPRVLKAQSLKNARVPRFFRTTLAANPNSYHRGLLVRDTLFPARSEYRFDLDCFLVTCFVVVLSCAKEFCLSGWAATVWLVSPLIFLYFSWLQKRFFLDFPRLQHPEKSFFLDCSSSKSSIIR